MTWKIEDVHILVSQRGRLRSEQGSANSTLPDVHEASLYRIDVNTSKSTSVLSNSPSESVVFVPKERIQTRSGENSKKQAQINKDKSPIQESKRIR